MVYSTQNLLEAPVEVQPGEAELLAGVVETLIEDTYIARRKRQDRMAAVSELRVKKSAERSNDPSSSGS